MNLTQAQKTTLKTHATANTNLTAGGWAVNTRLNGTPDDHQKIADWYNGIALAGDSQPLAVPLLVWRPSVMIQQLNTAIVWSASPAGADQPTISNSWLKWQSMTWANTIDMTDAQVRQGVSDVWGNASATDTAIKAKGCGRQDGTRLEVLLSPAGVGGGRVSPVFGQTISQPELTDALLNG